MLSSDQLIANWHLFIQKGHGLESYSANIHRLIENAANCEGDEQGGDDRQEEVDILGGLKHDDGQGET